MRWNTAGEAHGRFYVAVIEGIPAGLRLDESDIDLQLERRRTPYGRGPRMRQREDRAAILAGTLEGVTIGSPVAVQIGETGGAYSPSVTEKFTIPRPGHADLAGAYKYATDDLRLVWERASARETAARVAVGAVCLRLLKELGIVIDSFTLAVGDVSFEPPADLAPPFEMPGDGARCPDPVADRRMREAIDQANAEGDSLGGRCRAVAHGMPAGIGSFAQWDLRLDARIAAAMMSIPSVKGVQIGRAELGAASRGSAFHDAIEMVAGRPAPAGNRAGGIEGGLTTGRPVEIDLLVKPVPTLGNPLQSVDLATGEQAEAPRLRSDICVVPAVGVIAEAMLALELSRAVLEQLGADRLETLKARMEAFRNEAPGTRPVTSK
ncbi:MAG TPA: chorismate synthase [Acidobacteriota bacterium]|nr:chorismate synthase [Acidobacteriota bacterium]